MAKTRTKTKASGKPKVTDTSLIQVGEHNRYKLEPAISKTHYGERGLSSGGHPYAYRTRRADDAWFVVSEWDGRILGLLYQWSDGEWTFSKIVSHEQAPRWLASQMHGAVGSTVYNLASHLISGSTAVEAIARGIGIEVKEPSAKKTSRELNDEIKEVTGYDVAGIRRA
jgi:hypothetical protein